MTVTLESIRAAADLIADGVVRTPCTVSRTLSEITGATVIVKFENHQFTASFKERGALNALARLAPDARRQGVLAVSAGNHAQGVAYHARRLDTQAVIVMPRFTPHVKVERTRDHGAEIVLFGETFDEARQHGLALASERGLTIVHPYDDEDVISGQGTVALEMLDAFPDLQCLVVPVGGGGLVSGMAIAATALSPGIEIVGVETAGFSAVHAALHDAVPTFAATTIAEGIAVKQPGTLTLPIIKRLVREIVLVEEGDIEQAILHLLDIEKSVAEGAGAASLAALLAAPERFRGRKVGLVLSGGNIDPLLLSDIIERGMVRAGRLARLRVQLRDLPGALAKVTTCLADAGANIEEVHHQRAFTNAPVLSAEVEFVIQARGRAHIADILDQLARAGFRAELIGSPV
ncbi:MAG: threonine ammonia-lyase [Burkholderiales bacterium]